VAELVRADQSKGSTLPPYFAFLYATRGVRRVEVGANEPDRLREQGIV
jgi:hypothetical protein